MVEKKEDSKEVKEKVVETKVVEKVEKVKPPKKEEGVKKPKTSDRTVLLRELKEKAAKLASGIESVETGELKEEFDKKRELLIPLDDYVRTGIHLGTKVITPDMKKFV